MCFVYSSAEAEIADNSRLHEFLEREREREKGVRHAQRLFLFFSFGGAAERVLA